MQQSVHELSGDQYLKMDTYLLGTVLFSIFLLPSANPIPGWFAFRLEDLLLPLIALYLFIRRGFRFHAYAFYILAFAAYIFLTIAINGRLAEYRDYFEIFKLIKYLLYFWFFSLVAGSPGTIRILRWIFPLIFLFNLLHYFNLFDFNRIIEPFYASEVRLLFFGKNSLGEPATKRMLGTMDNPNNNAIVFLFFAAIFAPGNQIRKYDYLVFLLSFIGLLLTQSRTGMLAFVAIMIADIYIRRLNYKRVFFLLSMFIIGFVLINAIEYFDIQSKALPTIEEKNAFIDKKQNLKFDELLPATEYLTNVIESDVSERSVTGRLEAWQHLWGMIKLKPVFGHAPYKEYFYNNCVYSESEYILMTWRYGFIGLLLYLGFIVLPAILHFGKGSLLKYCPAVLFILVILITAFMNTPVCEPRILLLLAFAIAYFYFSRNQISIEHEEVADSGR
ncbi:MAG: O-antigen ligase family protein [Bacteroidetes bacterium]|nr:O-antigen ligase family protein [Bacteroidota bacterium]